MPPYFTILLTKYISHYLTCGPCIIYHGDLPNWSVVTVRVTGKLLLYIPSVKTSILYVVLGDNPFIMT